MPKKLIIALLTMLAAVVSGTSCASGNATANDHISNLSLNNDSLVTIKGAGFGKGPNVVLYDTFENASSGASVEKGMPKVGEWLKTGEPTIMSASSFSGNHSAAVIDTGKKGKEYLVFGIPDESSPTGLELFQEVYLSFALKDVYDFPGAKRKSGKYPERSTTKDAWLMLGRRGDRGSHTPDKPWSGNDIYIPGWTGGGFLIHGNNTGLSFWQGDLTRNWAFNDWNQLIFYASMNRKKPFKKGNMFFGFANDDNLMFNSRYGKPVITDESKHPYWDRVKFEAWAYIGDSRVLRLLDEVYIAIGENASAAIVIGDAKSISSSSALHHALPVSWKDKKIVADISGLSLNPDKDWYVFVFTADGEFNKVGVPLFSVSDPLPPSFTGSHIHG